MATVTTNPRTRLSKIPQARTYSATAARYADTFAKAIDQQEQNEIATNLSDFKLGNLSYDAFKKYLQGKIDSVPVGSKNKADWMSLMVDAEKYNKTNLETEATNKIQQLRSEFVDKFKGAMTTKDELALVTSMEGQVDKTTNAYEQLVAEEQKLKQQVASEGRAAGNKTLAQNLDQYFAAVANENKKIQEDYKAGRIGGMQADSQLYQNGLDMTAAINKAITGGISVPQSILSDANQATTSIQQRLAQRQVGQVFDVFDKSGNLLPVTHQDIINDANSASPTLVTSKFEPRAVGDGTYQVVDTTTGKPIPDVVAFSITEAAKLAKEQPGNQQSVNAPYLEQGTGLIRQKAYAVDASNNNLVFSSAGVNGTQVQSFSPVPGQENTFKVQPGSNIGSFIQTGVERIGSFPGDISGLSGSLQNASVLPEPVAPKQTSTSPQNGPTIGLPGNPFANPLTSTKTVQPKETLFSSNPFLKPPTTSPSQLIGPSMAPGGFSSPSSNIQAPTINPFSLNMGAPTQQREQLFSSLPGGSSSPAMTSSTSGPITGPTVSSPGIFDKIKSFGQSALGAIKSFFNGG